MLFDFSSGVVPICRRIIERSLNALRLCPYSKLLRKHCLAVSNSPFFQKEFPNAIHASKFCGFSFTDTDKHSSASLLYSENTSNAFPLIKFRRAFFNVSFPVDTVSNVSSIDVVRDLNLAYMPCISYISKYCNLPAFLACLR